MTQDQYGQPGRAGYVRDDAVLPDDENEDPTAESKPMTRLQKVASALRGGPERDEQDQAGQAADPQAPEAAAPRVTQQDDAAMANSPISQAQRQGDYWDEPAASAGGRDEAVAVTNPEVPVAATGTAARLGTARPGTARPGTARPGTDPLARQDQVTGQAGPDAADHPATQPDMFGTTTHAGNGAGSAPYPEDQVGEAANGARAAGVPAGGTSAGGAPAGDVPAGDVPAGDIPAGEVTGTTGRHAAGTPVGASAGTPVGVSAGTESRPGEAAGTLGDFSDLTYGNLIPDATVYLEQWQQVQFKFVDDPHASVTEAADIVAQVTAKLEAAIQERQRAIEERQRAIAEQQRSLRDRWGGGTNADTEGLRETLRMYRTFIDQLIGSRAG